MVCGGQNAEVSTDRVSQVMTKPVAASVHGPVGMIAGPGDAIDEFSAPAPAQK